MWRLALILAVLAIPAAAQDKPMSEAEFARFVKNKTLTYYYSKDVFGVEQYNADRSVIWQFDGGECRHGVWYEKDGDICFLYEHDPEPKCWAMYRTETGLQSVFTNRPGTVADVTEMRDSKPLICPGPELLGKTR